MSLGMQVGPALATLCSMDTQPQEKNGRALPTQFLAHVYCGQTAGWIKMPLGTEVNIGPGDVVLDGVAALLPRGHNP